MECQKLNVFFQKLLRESKKTSHYVVHKIIWKVTYDDSHKMNESLDP